MRQRQQAGRAGKRPRLSSAGTHCSLPVVAFSAAFHLPSNLQSPSWSSALLKPSHLSLPVFCPVTFPASLRHLSSGPTLWGTQCSLAHQPMGGRHVLCPTPAGGRGGRFPKPLRGILSFLTEMFLLMRVSFYRTVNIL